MFENVEIDEAVIEMQRHRIEGSADRSWEKTLTRRWVDHHRAMLAKRMDIARTHANLAGDDPDLEKHREDGAAAMKQIEEQLEHVAAVEAGEKRLDDPVGAEAYLRSVGA